MLHVRSRTFLCISRNFGTRSSLPHPLINQHLDDHLPSLQLGVLHCNLDSPLLTPGAPLPIIQQLNIPPRHDLPQPPINRIPHLHEAAPLVHQHQIHAPPQHRLPRLAHKLHDDRPADIPQLIDIDADLLEAQQKLRVREAEHAEGPLVAQAQRNGGAVGGLEVRDRERDLLVECQDLDAAGGGDGDAGVEEVDGVRVGGDVEVVEVAKELRGALAHAAEEEARRARGADGVVVALVVDGLEDFEGRGDAFALFVEDEGAVFHAPGGEEADVAGAGEFLWGVAGEGGGGGGDGGEGGGADGVEMVGEEGFVGDDKDEGEFFEDGDLRYAACGYGLRWDRRLVYAGDTS